MKLPSFAAAMHDTDYDLPNLIPPQTAFELVDPFDRPCESLNGQWHFALDPYDMGLRKNGISLVPLQETGLSILILMPGI